jgi:hypothetical protein
MSWQKRLLSLLHLRKRSCWYQRLWPDLGLKTQVLIPLFTMPLARAEEITVFPEDSGRMPNTKIEGMGLTSNIRS